MIINSKFKDYYDFIAHQYRDEKVVFNRENIVFDRETPTPKELCDVGAKVSFGISTAVGRSDDHSVDAIIIGGKVYQYYCRYGYIDKYQLQSDYFFNELPVSDIVNEQISDSKYFVAYFRKHFKQYKWGEYVPEFNDICVKYGPIIWFNQGPTQINPCFRTARGLMKILDPYTMIQDIMACIGSVTPHIPEQNNSDKITQAGFDTKQSFRHRK